VIPAGGGKFALGAGQCAGSGPATASISFLANQYTEGAVGTIGVAVRVAIKSENGWRIRMGNTEIS
jgi:hypothetical protein